MSLSSAAMLAVVLSAASSPSSFDGSRQRMLLEWSMGDDGEVTGLVLRPAPDSTR